jgi:L-threonylcarbamoyladenylate synthase
VTKPRRARVYAGTPRNLALLAARLQAGELVAVPTETVYGLAGNAFDSATCAKIFRAKGRPADDPLIVHIHRLEQLFDVCRPNEAALRLAQAFWPGPLTLVLPRHPRIPGIVTAGRDSVAVRMPRHRLFRRLLELTGLPLAAPSANRFGYISPTTAEHVREGLGDKISHILDGGAAPIGLESTIIDLRHPRRPVLLRPGAITVAELEAALGRPVRVASRGKSKQRRGKTGQLAPGLLKRHYSPRTPLTLHPDLAKALKRNLRPREAYLFFARPPGAGATNIFWLDAHGRPEGAARRLFATLRKLDGMKFTRIHAELAPGDGLARAINDRLQRAAAR